MVWVSDEYRERFIKLFEKYLNEDTPTGNARHRELVANIVSPRALRVRFARQAAREQGLRG